MYGPVYRSARCIFAAFSSKPYTVRIHARTAYGSIHTSLYIGIFTLSRILPVSLICTDSFYTRKLVISCSVAWTRYVAVFCVNAASISYTNCDDENCDHFMPAWADIFFKGLKNKALYSKLYAVVATCNKFLSGYLPGGLPKIWNPESGIQNTEYRIRNTESRNWN